MRGVAHPFLSHFPVGSKRLPYLEPSSPMQERATTLGNEERPDERGLGPWMGTWNRGIYLGHLPPH